MHETQHLGLLHDLCTSQLVQSLLRLHPNELAAEEASIPEAWSIWLDWARDTPNSWLKLIDYYMSEEKLRVEPSIPRPLQEMVDKIKYLQLLRDPIPFTGKPLPIQDRGMSPKKTHEVSRMVKYILNVIHANKWDTSTLRIVDVGAGQGYLTRALKTLLPETWILALDADKEQTNGSQRWEQKLNLGTCDNTHRTIWHKTIHITPDRLFQVVDEWIGETSAEGGEEKCEVPVMLIGLHACGSLTPDVLRTFMRSGPRRNHWKFVASLVVGCCYNLMNSCDFPLSQFLGSLSPKIDLPMSAYHLAAQVPTQWLSTLSPPTPRPSVELAIRKVTWRALLGKHIRARSGQNQSEINIAPGRQMPWSRLPLAKVENYDPNEVGTGATPEMRRLGRLRDATYHDWMSFLDAAGKKMGTSVVEMGERSRDQGLERFLEVVHTLRCLLGPAVESAILLDRLLWVHENLKNINNMDVSLVNLFDQRTGSGRNVAIVVAPSIPLL